MIAYCVGTVVIARDTVMDKVVVLYLHTRIQSEMMEESQ